MIRSQDGEAIEPRKQQVQDHQLVASGLSEFQSPNAVERTVHHETLGGQRTRDEAHDSGLVVDHQHPRHDPPILREQAVRRETHDRSVIADHPGHVGG